MDIQFSSSWLTASIRGSSSVCKDDGDSPVNSAQFYKKKKETHVSKYTNAAEVENRSRAKMLTLSGGRHGAKTICHGLLSLGVLFVGISQSFLSLLCLAKHSFLRLLSIRLSSSRNIISFSRSIELRL
jgi:hypothetical protein